MFRLKTRAFLLVLVLSLSSALFAAPVQAATTISITSPTNSSTVTGSSFAVTGTATANRTVSVKVNGSAVGSTTSNGSGNWSLNVTGQTIGAKTIEATATGQLMYVNVLNVADFPSSRMSKINTLTNTEEDSFSIFGAGQFPINWKANPTFTKAYGVAPYLNSATVWVMDLVTGVITTFTLPGAGQRGASIAYNADGSKVYITDNANTDVIVYDTATNTQIGSAIGTGGAPHSNARRPGTNEIWIDNSASNSLTVINTITDTVIQTYAVAGPPNGLTFSPDGETAYVGLGSGGGSLAVVNADTGVTTNTITGTAAPEFLTISSDGKKVYVSHPSTTTVDVFDTISATLSHTITGLPTGTWGLALTADDSRLYVTSPDLYGGLTGTTVSLVDTTSFALLNSIVPGGGAPFYIFAAPPESASASTTFTLASASATLADTGMNRNLIALAAFSTITLGMISLHATIRRKHQLR